MANKSDNDNKVAADQPVTESTGVAADANPRVSEESTLPLDEYGEPLAHEDEPEIRRRPLYKRPAFLMAALVVLLVFAIVGLRYWLYARSHESTDDAFIDGHIIQVSPKISGYIAKVYVTDNQQVKAGDLLADLDPRATASSKNPGDADTRQHALEHTTSCGRRS
jgi:hypothetical protein